MDGSVKHVWIKLMTYALLLDGDRLLILAFKWPTEETKSKVHCGG